MNLLGDIGLWKRDLTSVLPNETIRIIYGEPPCALFRGLKKDFERAYTKPNVNFWMITGPVIPVEEDTNSNAILELAEKGVLDLWISPHLPVLDYRSFGVNGFVRDKEHNSERTFDFLLFAKYNYDFDNLIESLQLPRFNEPNSFVGATEQEINQAKFNLGEFYDFTSKETLRSLFA